MGQGSASMHLLQAHRHSSLNHSRRRISSLICWRLVWKVSAVASETHSVNAWTPSSVSVIAVCSGHQSAAATAVVWSWQGQPSCCTGQGLEAVGGWVARSGQADLQSICMLGSALVKSLMAESIIDDHAGLLTFFSKQTGMSLLGCTPEQQYFRERYQSHHRAAGIRQITCRAGTAQKPGESPSKRPSDKAPQRSRRQSRQQQTYRNAGSTVSSRHAELFKWPP